MHLTGLTPQFEMHRGHRSLLACAAVAIAAVFAPPFGLAAGAAAQPRGTRSVELVNVNRRISAAEVRKAAAALQLQVNEDLRQWWAGPGVKIVIEPPDTVGTKPER